MIRREGILSTTENQLDYNGYNYLGDNLCESRRKLFILDLEIG